MLRFLEAASLLGLASASGGVTYEVVEIRLTGSNKPSNPFAVDCSARVEGPEGSTRNVMNIPMFYDDVSEWAFRFSPDVAGVWTWKTDCSQPQYQGCYKEDINDRDMPTKVATRVSPTECQSKCAGHKYFGQHADSECWCGDSFGKHGEAQDCLPASTIMEEAGQMGKRNCVYSVAGANDSGLHMKQGSVQVQPGSRRGGIVQDKQHKQMYTYENGTPYMLVGLQADWLWALELRGEDTGGYLDHLQSYGFNHYLVQLFSNYSDWNKELPPWQPPRYSPSSPTPWASADYTVLETRYFKSYDRFLSLMDDRGLIAHIMLYVGNKNVVWPTRGSRADYTYWRYCLARFSAYSSALWDVSKEAASYGVPSTYVLDRLQYMTDHNPNNRLITSHSGLGWSNRCTKSGDDPNDGLCTMATLQVHYTKKKYADLDVLQQEPFYYDDIVNKLEQDANVPVFNSEFFYEAGIQRQCNGSCCNACASDTDALHAMRRVMWDMYMAGSSGAWYNCDVSWDVIVPATNSTGFWYVRHLNKFWKTLDFNKLTRSNELISKNESTVHCATAGSDIIVHSRSHSPFIVNIPSNSVNAATWFDPVTGQSQKAEATSYVYFDAAVPHYTPPSAFEDDAVLHLQVVREPTVVL